MSAASRIVRHRVRMVYRARSIVLSTGAHVIGRAPSSTVVIDERSVSRRHARIRIADHGASIEDLGSANGVFVNGQRVHEPEALEDGDVVMIGQEELVVRLETVPAGRTESEPVRAPWSGGDAGPGIGPPGPTDRVNAFTLLAVVAERALAEGRPSQAQHSVEPRLLAILSEAERSPASVDSEAIERALSLSLALADALASRRWLDYAIDLLTAVSKPCTEELAEALLRAKSRVGKILPDRLDTYARAIRKLTSTTATVRTLTIIDELGR